MGTPLKVLIIEDSENDTLLMVETLRRGGYQPIFRQVFTANDLHQALREESWDIILSDHNMPSFNSPDALRIVQEHGVDLPFIIVSGSIGEETAVTAMKAGAHDYLMKSNLARLIPAVERELRESAIRSAQRRAEQALRESEQRNRLIWENSNDAVLLLDSEGKIQFANPVVEPIFGYRPSELIGRDFQILLPHAVRGEFTALFREYSTAADGRKPERRMFEISGLHKSGRELPLEVAFSHMELSGKRLYVAFLRDVTQRKKAEEELEENQEQFRVARDIQQRLFPEHPPKLPGYDLSGLTCPAEATGGDYFDFVPMVKGCWGLVVADVTGHGVGPAMLMAETRAYLRILCKEREDVAEIVCQANQMLAQDVGFERFVTMLFLKLDPDKRLLHYVNAGHPSGFVVDASGKVRHELKRMGPPLGIQPKTRFESSSPIELQPGDLVLSITDGIEETIGQDNNFFGVDRILEVVHGLRNRPANEIVNGLFDAARKFSHTGAAIDDFTAIVLKVV